MIDFVLNGYKSLLQGVRVYKVMIKELLGKGMKSATNVIKHPNLSLITFVLFLRTNIERRLCIGALGVHDWDFLLIWVDFAHHWEWFQFDPDPNIIAVCGLIGYLLVYYLENSWVTWVNGFGG
ncbi:hypothetical protein Hanom_Chr06g00552351 [Helianthus anomalus]